MLDLFCKGLHGLITRTYFPGRYKNLTLTFFKFTHMSPRVHDSSPINNNKNHDKL